MTNEADISENKIFTDNPGVLEKLLLDHTTHKNIFWATNSYADRGDGFSFYDEITVEHITGVNGQIIQPRAIKALSVQTQRSKDMAEVFTPSWICNAQNNLIDEAWFGRPDVFNVVNEDDHTWQPTEGKIEFPEGKTWKDYVRDNRLEITCGEAPYLASRYDTVTGEPINPLSKRIGLLDRKLRVVGENTESSGDWLKWAKEALKSTYGFEWQGDNLLLARETLLYTFCDYYEEKFGTPIPQISLDGVAHIISWNLWQMDGLKGVIPGSCHDRTDTQQSLFGDVTTTVTPCEGCAKDDIRRHNGTYALVKDWGTKKKIRFIDLIK